MMTMDIDNLRQEWKSIEVPPCKEATRELERKVASGKGAHSLRDRLKRISLRLTAECVIGALCLIPLVSEHVLLVVLVSAFFVVMGVMHAVQYRMLSRLDLSAATVIEALGMVCRLESFRRTRRMIGLTLMVPLMVYMVMSFADSYGVYMLPCCLLGLVAGCVVGIAVNRRTTKLLREMKSTADAS